MNNFLESYTFKSNFLLSIKFFLRKIEKQGKGFHSISNEFAGFTENNTLSTPTAIHTECTSSISIQSSSSCLLSQHRNNDLKNYLILSLIYNGMP